MNEKSIADDLIKNMPDVQENAIAAEQIQKKTILEKFVDLVDRFGDPFDPEKHQTDKHGNPKLSPKGKAILKPKSPPGPKPGGGTPPKSTIGGLNEPYRDIPDEQRVDYVAMGKIAAQLTFKVGDMIGGDEWKPKPEEEISISASWTVYLASRNTPELPPGWMLLGTIFMYVTPRLRMPKTQTRLQKITGWFKRKFKLGKRNGAQSNSGNDGIRENDISDKPIP